MEIYDLPDNELNRVTLKKLNKTQENKDKQLNEMKITMHEQNQKFNQQIETTKKNQTENLELKNTRTELKKINRELQQQTCSCKRKNQRTQMEMI